jgi:hypothetical protein
MVTTRLPATFESGQHARAHRLAVEEHRARAALTDAAAVLRPLDCRARRAGTQSSGISGSTSTSRGRALTLKRIIVCYCKRIRGGD